MMAFAKKSPAAGFRRTLFFAAAYRLSSNIFLKIACNRPRI